MTGCLSSALVHALVLEVTKHEHKSLPPDPAGHFHGPFFGLHAVLPHIPLSFRVDLRRRHAVFLLRSLRWRHQPRESGDRAAGAGEGFPSRRQCAGLPSPRAGHCSCCGGGGGALHRAANNVQTFSTSAQRAPCWLLSDYNGLVSSQIQCPLCHTTCR